MALARVAIVTDSGASLPPALQSRYGITVLPLRLAIGDEQFAEGVNISPPRVVSALLGGDKVRSLAPAPAYFAAAYSSLAEQGATAVLSLHLSGALSDTVEVAREAAAYSPVPVRVIDSRTLAMALGFTTLAAAAIASGGASAEDVEAAALTTLDGARLQLTIETLDYVHRAGSVPRLLKTLSDVTNQRPILTVVDGKVEMVGRARGTQAAREKVRADALGYASTLTRPAVATAIVGGSVADEHLALGVPGELVDGPVGASLAAQTGPGTYLVAVAPMPAAYLG